MIRSMSRVRATATAILLSGVMFGASAQAQEISPEHLAAARAAVTALGATSQFDAILPGLSERLKAELIQGSPNVEEAISSTVDAQALALAPRRADLERESATIFARTFSLEELKGITDFYNSEAGKKLLTHGPIATRELLKAADIWAAGINRDLSANSMAELQKVAGAQLQPLPADAGVTPGGAAAPKP